jgi:NADH:ubiquinone oxidoreductase subunit 3 (subunit A)
MVGGAALLTQYGYVAIFVVVAVLFTVIALVLGALLRPRKPNSVKLSSYECGVESEGSSWVQYFPGFYIYALVFVVFEVETVFLYPWAVAYGKLGIFAFLEMLVFVGLLVLGLAYAWRKGALKWM